MFFFKRKVCVDTERLYLRAPAQTDYRQWSELRHASKEFLTPWEPTWSPDHLSRKSFSNRVYWSQKNINGGTAIPLFMFRREDDKFVGAITLDNIRHGPAQTGTMGYWIGQPYARHGYMTEALLAMVHYAFSTMDISRVESACLPENVASRGVLEKCGYKYEGVAQAYIQINGRWRTHVLYAALRADRRGRTTVGMA
jgi:ribosomal-protein-alanine N-acetyltransferase